ncbi:MAG TPA: aminotransferase class I/II-fold pyridoxal phosphate-dependent enzyme [Gaiellaceae bacterium]|jgi:aminotransferase|nr:aminotransferase class I/II-fold pyridoxal phosphate-dependent enzyme [Gaiellaceae bacterium]
MRGRPARIQRLPQQYFGGLLARVTEHAGRDGEPLVDLGRGNPETGPPAHVVEALDEAAGLESAHGYAPFRSLPELRAALAERYRSVYGVQLDPDAEVAVVPGTKTAIVELSLVLAEEGQTVVLPDPFYPDYPSGPALAGADIAYAPLDPGNGWPPDFSQAPAENVAAVYLNYPSNPAAVAVPDGAFEEAVAYAETTGAAIVHDFAYGDLVFDGRSPRSFLATLGAKEIGVELFSMSKSYGMAGWRVGFVAGNAEIVERINLLNDHCRGGIFRPIQEACIAALTGPQDSVAARRDTYQRRRDRVLEVLEPLLGPLTCEGTFYIWIKFPEGVTFESLISEHRVVVAPGDGFGPSGADHARLSLAVSDETLELGLERLAAALDR